MKLKLKLNYSWCILCLWIFSCGNPSIELPVLNISSTQKVKKKERIFIGIDDSEADSVAFKLKSYKPKRNWILHIDKRLKLRQVLTPILLLQNQRNEAETSDLGNYFIAGKDSEDEDRFLEIKNIRFHPKVSRNEIESHSILPKIYSENSNYLVTIMFQEDSASINGSKIPIAQFANRLHKMDSLRTQMEGKLYLAFDENLTVQHYLDYKSAVIQLKLKHSKVAEDEYIFY